MGDRDVKLARWFFTHAFANALIGLTAVWTTFTDPMNAVDSRVYSDTSLFGAASSWPLTIVNAVHVYHMVGGFSLTGADYFHHLLFIPAISYFMLGLLKTGHLEAMVERRITANLNCWIRVPGILIHSFIVYQAVLYSKHTLPFWCLLLQVTLPFYNALYYCKQAVANYTVHYMTSLLKQDKVMHQRMEEFSMKEDASLHPPTIAADVRMSWKEALSVPQRGC